MKWKPYPKYKESGVEWLGSIPAPWSVIRLRFLCQVNTGDKDTVDASEDGSYPFYVRSQTVERIDSFTCECEAVLTAGDGVGVGKVFHYHGGGPFDYHQRVYMLHEFQKLTGKFLYYYLKENFYKVALEGGAKSTVDSLRMPLFLNFQVALPPLREQIELTRFLDRETTKIEALISKQELLIELLQEKRQALISHAVTKGLNPDAPMKPSGVEWLGEVPAHWETRPVKHYFSILDGRRIPLSSEERGERQGAYPYFGASGIIDYVDDFLFDEDLVLVSEDGANLVNRTTPVAFVAQGRYWVNNHAHILRPRDGLSQYWALRLEAVDYLPFLTGSAQPKLTIDALANTRIAAPPTQSERQLILEEVENQADPIDVVIKKAVQSIALMREHRTALISAAVTGKIDVRDVHQSNHA